MSDRPYDKFYVALATANAWVNRNILGYLDHEHGKIIEYVNADSNTRVLDYGCGAGYLAEQVRKRYQCQVMGADINPQAVAKTQERDITAKIITSSFFENYRSYFDVIILSHVLEHVEDPLAMLEGIHTLLKEEGVLAIAVPQERFRGDTNPLPTLYFFLKLNFENPHRHKFSKRQLFSLLNQAGFRPKEDIFVNFFPPFLSKERNFWRTRSLIAKCVKVKQ